MQLHRARRPHDGLLRSFGARRRFAGQCPPVEKPPRGRIRLGLRASKTSESRRFGLGIDRPESASSSTHGKTEGPPRAAAETFTKLSSDRSPETLLRIRKTEPRSSTTVQRRTNPKYVGIARCQSVIDAPTRDCVTRRRPPTARARSVHVRSARLATGAIRSATLRLEVDDPARIRAEPQNFSAPSWRRRSIARSGPYRSGTHPTPDRERARPGRRPLRRDRGATSLPSSR